MNSGIAHSNGIDLYYETHGIGDPLVLIMGIGYDASLWTLNQTPYFAEHFHTIQFDNRDVGRSSSASTDYSIDTMADDVAAVLDTLDIEKAHVLGISMGGMIGLSFALRHPGRLNKLIVTGTGAAPARAAFDPISIWNYVKQTDESGETFAAQQFIWLFSESFRRNREAVNQTLELLASNPNPVSPEAYQRQANAYVQFDRLDDLNRITAPTLVLAGEQDRLTPPWICQEIADGIPGARFELLTGDGASHVLPLERPDDFNRRCYAFLKEVQ